MTLKYFYQVDLIGNPIPGSNVATFRKPIVYGAGQRWVQFTPQAQAAPCCESGPELPTTTGHKVRYYVRLNTATLLPIPGSLFKAKWPPREYKFQELIGTWCCD